MTLVKKLLFTAALVCVSASPVFATNPIPPSQYTDVQNHIVNGTWTSLSDQVDGRPLYVFHLRSCPFCQAFLKEEKDALTQAGIDIRAFPFPGGGSKVDDVAYLAFVRNKEVFEQYDNKRSINAPDIQNSQGYIDAFNANRESVLFARSILDKQGVFSGTPLFVYQDSKGAWNAIAGYSKERFAPVKAELLKPAFKQIP